MGIRVKLNTTPKPDRGKSPISGRLFVKHFEKFREEPFNGTILAGESFTDTILGGGDVSYIDIMEELKPIADLNISHSEIFLLVNIDFAGDLWDIPVWSRVAKILQIWQSSHRVNLKV